jgi:hypothetical protein
MTASPPVEEGAEEEPEPGQQVRLRGGGLQQVRVVCCFLVGFGSLLSWSVGFGSF